MTEDLVVLLDEHRRPCGTMPRSEVHGPDTPLHLAFSVYLFDAGGRVLMTRRALGKLTWPGVWTNACCGHVRPDETPAAAAVRRLGEELGVHPRTINLALPDFRYRARSAEGIVENEVCPVFVGHLDATTELTPAPGEVAEWTWADWAGVRVLAVDAPWAISPWAAEQIPLLPANPPTAS